MIQGTGATGYLNNSYPNVFIYHVIHLFHFGIIPVWHTPTSDYRRFLSDIYVYVIHKSTIWYRYDRYIHMSVCDYWNITDKRKKLCTYCIVLQTTYIVLRPHVMNKHVRICYRIPTFVGNGCKDICGCTVLPRAHSIVNSLAYSGQRSYRDYWTKSFTNLSPKYRRQLASEGAQLKRYHSHIITSTLLLK